MRARTWILAAAISGCTEAPRERRELAAAPSVDDLLAAHRALLDVKHSAAPALRARAAAIVLPKAASDPARVEDVHSHVAVRFALEGAKDVGLATSGELAIAQGVLGPGVDVVYRIRPEGLEDYVVHPVRPAEETTRYRVDLSGVAGLRLVARTLELMDADGTPRLRMAPPYLVDSRGVRHEVGVAVKGCTVDRDPRPPWHRPVTAAGASTCTVELDWTGRDVVYPAALDPAWTATKGVMTVDRIWNAVESGMALLPSGQVLVAGGRADGSAELYDPATETWAATGSLASSSYGDASMAPVGPGRVLFVNGIAGVYDAATGTWTMVTPVSADTYCARPLVDGRVLVLGYRAAQIFDPATSTFSAAPSLSIQRTWHCAAVLPDGRVLVTGGHDPVSGVTLPTTEVFDPAGKTWSPGPPMSIEREVHTCTRLGNGSILVTGGETALRAVRSSEIYDAATNTWLPPNSSLSFRRVFHMASPLPSGKVLVTGGDDGVPEPVAEIYDPTLERWLTAGNLITARSFHGQVTLATGDVLVAGGYDADYRGLKSSEIFHILATGASCTNDGECSTGHCTDGVCCDQSCQAACYACSAAKKRTGSDGLCGPIGEGPDPSGRCHVLPVATCGEDGRCNGFGACASHPKGTECAPLTCTGGVLSQSTCDGEGSCVAQTTSCGAYACATAVSCGSGSCSSDAECAPAFACESGACVAKKPFCDGDHTLVDVDGTRTDCAPYKCDGLVCIARCNSAIQCAGTHVCNRNGVCVAPEDGLRDDGEAFLGGCASSKPSQRADGVVLLVVIGVFLRRRRGGAT